MLYVIVIVVLCWFIHVYSYNKNSLQKILLFKFLYDLIVDGITRGEGTPQRPRKQLDLPVLPSMMQQRNQEGGEIESKLQEEIMKMNGILSINGKVGDH